MLVLALKFSRNRDDERRPEIGALEVVSLGACAPRKRNRETIKTAWSRPLADAPCRSDKAKAPYGAGRVGQ